jgi:hypothetical protein
MSTRLFEDAGKGCADPDHDGGTIYPAFPSRILGELWKSLNCIQSLDKAGEDILTEFPGQSAILTAHLGAAIRQNLAFAARLSVQMQQGFNHGSLGFHGFVF